MSFDPSVSRVDLVLLAADERTPLAEVHHHVVYETSGLSRGTCGFVCANAKPLSVPVSFIAHSEDAGTPDADTPDAEAAPDAGTPDAGTPDAEAAPAPFDAAPAAPDGSSF